MFAYEQRLSLLSLGPPWLVTLPAAGLVPSLGGKLHLLRLFAVTAEIPEPDEAAQPGSMLRAAFEPNWPSVFE